MDISQFKIGKDKSCWYEAVDGVKICLDIERVYNGAIVCGVRLGDERYAWATFDMDQFDEEDFIELEIWLVDLLKSSSLAFKVSKIVRAIEYSVGRLEVYVDIVKKAHWLSSPPYVNEPGVAKDDELFVRISVFNCLH